VPLSVFVTPVKVDAELVQSIVTASAAAGSSSSSSSSPPAHHLCTALKSSTDVKLGASRSVGDALKLTSAVLNVRLINAASFTATYYGRLTLPFAGSSGSSSGVSGDAGAKASMQAQYTHVCVLVKGSRQGDPLISVDVRCSQPAYAQHLLQELLDAL
jgi:hypothetical protein